MTKNRLSVLVLIAILLVGFLPVPSNAQPSENNGVVGAKYQPDNQSKIAGSIVITDRPDEVVDYARRNQLKPNAINESTRDSESVVALDEMPDDPKVKALSRELGVRIAPNYIYETLFTPNDPNFGAQWNLAKISAPAAWDITRGDEDTVIAIIDTGVLFEQTFDGNTYSQPDFPLSRMWTNPLETGMTQSGDACWTGTPEDKRFNDCDDSGNGLIDDWRGWDYMGGFRGSGENCPNHLDGSAYQHPTNANYVEQDNDPQPYSCDSPDLPDQLNKDHYNDRCPDGNEYPFDVAACYVGHGTVVTSVAAAATNNSQLVAGIDHRAQIMNLRVADGYGFSTTARVAVAIQYAVDNGADAINISLGASCSNESFTDSVVETALAAATNAGTVVVAASGNNGFSTICYPASHPDVVAVGATNSSDLRRSYSNYSSKLDVVAPDGVPVANAPSAAFNTNYLSSVHGTSLSTPHVVGQAALLKAHEPGLSRSQIISRIRNQTDKVSGMSGQNFHNQYGYGRINLLKTLTNPQPPALPPPVYRLYNASTNNHLYTTSASERNKAVSQANFTFEGIAFRVCDSGGSPIYRLYNPVTGRHFFTKSASERDKAAANTNYFYEGIAFRVCGSKSVHRLYSHPAEKHFYTTSASERDKLVSQTSFVYEGVSFKVD